MSKKDSVLIGLVVAMIVAVFFVPRFGQDPLYHNFADQRLFLGIPNFFDVVSNLPFLAAGLLGIGTFHRLKVVGFARISYLVFYLGLVLVFFGSSYYHWQPSTGRLFWDRLPMTIAFMGFLSGLIGLRISQKLGKILLLPLLVIGLVSVVYWRVTEIQGAGDMRPYVMVQFGMILLTVVILFLYRGSAPGNSAIGYLFFFYMAAKATEAFDRQLFELLFHSLSGHSIKHILAGIGAWMFIKKQT